MTETVKEYAEEQNLSVQEVLIKCRELGLKADSKDSILDEDAIIMLDNAINVISTDSEIDYNEADVLDEAVENIMMESNLKEVKDNGAKKQKLKKKNSSDTEYAKNKKAMYKNKEKLTSNEVDENVIAYKENMTVGELAQVLNVNGTELVKKLFELGMMLNINQSIDFGL